MSETVTIFRGIIENYYVKDVDTKKDSFHRHPIIIKSNLCLGYQGKFNSLRDNLVKYYSVHPRSVHTVYFNSEEDTILFKLKYNI